MSSLHCGLQWLSAVNHIHPLCCLFQIIYPMQIPPEFRRNWAPRDVTGDVWEQRGIPLSWRAIWAPQLWKLLKSSTKLLPPLLCIFFPPFLKSNFYNPISGPCATAHLCSSREVIVVSVHGARAVLEADGAVPGGDLFQQPLSCWMDARPRRPALGWMLAAAINRAFAGDGITHTRSSS